MNSERDTMRAWFLFAILAFLVFGVPLIHELYKMRVRRKAITVGQILGERVSLVPDVDQQEPVSSSVIAPAGKVLEEA